MNFQDELNRRTEETEKVLASYLPKEEGFAKTMAQAMNYSVLAGGKRLRPMLILETLRMFGGEEKLAYPFMAAMEMIHTHSLVHDDLPVLDNDDYRRGRLTTHKVYGEAMGVLSGVALLNYAYEVMFSAFDRADTPKDQANIIQALKVMSHKTGLYGMLGGQSVDVENDGKPMNRQMLDYIYENKTSALIEASMMTGAILGGASAEEVAAIEKAAKNVGLAFQIQDDILDVTSTAEELGKPIHSDEKNHKTTYVTIMGIEKASQQVKELSDEAVELLEGLNKKNEFLFTLVKELVGRRK
nr:farnesyl diphosphate synthase [uncultured Blautia sp.]